MDLQSVKKIRNFKKKREKKEKKRKKLALYISGKKRGNKNLPLSWRGQ
jgi:hypothetical protein